MRTRTTRFAAVLAVGVLALAGCSSDDDGEDTSTAGTSAESGSATSAGGGEGGELSLEGVELVEDGQLTVCSDMPYTPFEFEDEETGETTGFDYDVVSAMGEQLGVDVVFNTTPFDGILGSLQAGDCDMVASAMTITEERAEQVSFTEPYFDADQSLLIRAEDEGTYTALEDLAGKTIGVQSGTTGEEYANENLPEGATVRQYQTGEEIFTAMLAGDVDAALQDFPVNAYRAATSPEEFAVTETFPTGEQYGFAVTKENEALLAALDAALAAIREDGTYDEIFAEWFGEG